VQSPGGFPGAAPAWPVWALCPGRSPTGGEALVAGQRDPRLAAAREQAHDLLMALFEQRLDLHAAHGVAQRPTILPSPLVPRSQAAQPGQRLPAELLARQQLPFLVRLATLHHETLQELTLVERDGGFEARNAVGGWNGRLANW